MPTVLKTGWHCGDSFNEQNEAEIMLHVFQGCVIIRIVVSSWFSNSLCLCLSLVSLRTLAPGTHSPCCEDAQATWTGPRGGFRLTSE